MRKLISILVALGLILSFSLMAAAPVGAVEEPVYVYLQNKIACKADNYTLAFHNVGTLLADDWIDIMFYPGTDASGAIVPTNVYTGVKKGDVVTPTGVQVTTGTAVAVNVGASTVSASSVRIVLSAAIEKCDWVSIVVENVTNPTSCSHSLEVGTTTHTPVNSEPYTVYCAKISLAGGVLGGKAVMNLISLPCYPEDTSIEAVLADMFDEVAKTAATPNPFSFSVWYWDNDSDTWFKYVSDSSFTDLETMEAGKAYWIKPSYDFDFYIHGDPYPPGQGPPVKWCYPRCWNMVGFASLTDMDAEDYLAYTKLVANPSLYAVIAIWGWDVSTQMYAPFTWDITGDLAPTDQFVTGQGYWMAFFEEACIIPPSQTC